MTSYNITLKDAEGGLVGSFECPSDTYILDQLEDYFQYMLEFQRNSGSLTVHQERFVIRTRQPGIDTQGASSRKARMRFSLRLSNKVPRNKKHLIT